MQMKLTFYGWLDNDPPGDAIAYPTHHQIAGGVGTYDDPVTTATMTDQNGGQLSAGTRLYVPSLRKYLVIEDECASCTANHIDVWMDSDPAHSQAVLDCEESWTPDKLVDVEVNPPRGRDVDVRPFFQNDVCRIP